MVARSVTCALEGSFSHWKLAARAAERCAMTAVSDRKAEEPAQWCPQCGAAGEFGYRNI
jgi:hypothetical protein